MTDDDNRIWALREAAKASGLSPNETSVAGFLTSLETEGLLHQSETGNFWMITDKGRAELIKLETRR